MKISREFKGDEYERSTREICSFWEGQDYTISKVNEDRYVGKRGHIIHNLFTISMNKLATSIVIDTSGEGVEVVIDVNTFGTWMTKSEGALWDVEFDMFESFLKNEEVDPELMKQYKKKKNRVVYILYAIAIIISVIIGLIIGGFIY